MFGFSITDEMTIRFKDLDPKLVWKMYADMKHGVFKPFDAGTCDGDMPQWKRN